MTGGLAWVYDEDGGFLAKGRYHGSFLQSETWDELDHGSRHSARDLVELHAAKTASTRAWWLLEH